MEAEVLFILVLALIVLGPRRLPEIGRQIGKALAELRRAKWEFTRQIEEEIRRIEEEEEQAKVAKALPASEGAVLKAEPDLQPLDAQLLPAEAGQAPSAAPPEAGLPVAAPRPENTILKPVAAPHGTIQMELGAEPHKESGSPVAEADAAISAGAAASRR